MTATVPPGFEQRTVDGLGELLLPQRPDIETLARMAVPVRVRAQQPEDADPNEPVIDLIGSVQTVDEYETIFVQSGMDARDFDRNPVFLRQHDGGSPPLGLIEKHWRTSVRVRVRRDDRWVQEDVPATAFRARFDVAEDPAEDDMFQQVARCYLRMYRQKIMRAASIRFAPIAGEYEFGSEMSESKRKKWGLSEYGILFKKWRLVELSAVTLPGNKDALRRGLPRLPEQDELDRAFERISALERQVRALTESGSTRSEDPTSAGGRSETNSADHDHVAAQGTPDGEPAEAHAQFRGADGLSPEDLERTLASLRALRAG